MKGVFLLRDVANMENTMVRFCEWTAVSVSYFSKVIYFFKCILIKLWGTSVINCIILLESKMLENIFKNLEDIFEIHVGKIKIFFDDKFNSATVFFKNHPHRTQEDSQSTEKNHKPRKWFRITLNFLDPWVAFFVVQGVLFVSHRRSLSFSFTWIHHFVVEPKITPPFWFWFFFNLPTDYTRSIVN